MSAHDRLARIARDVLRENFASIEDQADAMAAAIITELGITQEWGIHLDANELTETHDHWKPWGNEPSEDIKARLDAFPDRSFGYRLVTSWINEAVT